MDLPEVPLIDLPTSRSFTCPCCNKKVGTWVVSAAFNCPSCGKPLTSNKRQAFNRGLSVGVVVYVALAIAMYMLERRLPVASVLIYGLGAVVAFYSGYFTYRRSVVIAKRPG